MEKTVLTKENLDDILKQLGKEFRKLNGKVMPAEIVMVRGAAIVAQYGFRNSTTDIDAVISASSALKQAANKVGDANGLSNGWLNQDFKNTGSFSEKIVQYSIPYKTFANILHVRVLSGKFLVAMKLASLRDYKYDKSDIVGIVENDDLKYDDICEAVSALYGGWPSLPKPEKAKAFIESIYNKNDLNILYEEIRNMEISDNQVLKRIDKEYDGLLNEDNVEDVLAKARESLKKRKE